MLHLINILCKLFLIFTSLIGHAICSNVAPLNTEESVNQSGYPLEKYKLQTLDKFTLGLERIPYSKNGDRTIGKPILLMHGLFLSSFVFTNTNKSLSYSLSEAGYDVWLFNARGTGLSRTYSIYSKAGAAPRMNKMSWDFSFHEMGIYDFPAAVDFVLNKTGRPKLDVVGYSLGATIALVGLSEKPAYNNKVDKLVLMAPTTIMISHRFPISAFHRGSLLFKYSMKEQNFFPAVQDPDAAHRYLRWLCTYTIFYPYCLLYIDTAQGSRINYNRDMVVSTLTDFPQPVSKKMLFHWVQLMSSKRFCKYDYGVNGNMQHYNTKSPPDYNLSKVTTAVYILHSKDDNLSAIKDVNWLADKLPNVKDIYYIDNIKFGHLSFVMHANIDRLINNKIKNALLTKAFN
ncbi:gastric triacylglycerol lipase-like [Rhopalosiphum maidis]|uniref:gastric triacylglycerol lipase-like n=1 Tax=Rhopalosiphum maidis TaxID=43146 RepID=UPI000EFDD8FB|nr:gastric triacylglycerol lipase-like [Rhopalosiphum maidis]